MLLDQESDNESGCRRWNGGGEPYLGKGKYDDWSDEEDVQPLVYKDCKGDGLTTPNCTSAPSKFDLLPLELVLEVCRLAHPQDVLALARSNKHLRGVLTSRKAVSIWKASWENTNGAPSCPDDQTYMQWTQLIFWTECTICWNRHRVRKVHFALRIRPCEKCVKSVLVAMYANGEVPKMNALDALEILPHSTELYDRDSSGLISTWLHSAVLATVDTLRELAGHPDSGDALEKFKSEETAKKQAIEEADELARHWLSRCRKDARQARRKVLTVKLLQAGHDKKDVRSCLIRSSRTSSISEKSWEALRPKYEATVEKIKLARLEYERKDALDKKRAVADKLWKDYNLKQAFDLFTPDNLYDAPGFTEIIESNESLDVASTKLQAAMDNVPQQLQEWRRRSKLGLLKKIGEALQFDVSDSMTTEQVDSELRHRGEAINVVFECTSWRRVTLHLASALRHGCLGSWKKPIFDCLMFDTKASKTISDILVLMELDPKSTKKEMDRVKARFTCKTCPDSSYARTWRNCIVHTHEHKEEVLLGWNLLDDQTAAIVIEYENLSCGISRMICLICPPSNERYGYPQRLERHFRSWHDKIPSPGEYIADPKCTAIPTKPILIPTIDELEAYKIQLDQEILEARAKGSNTW